MMANQIIHIYGPSGSGTSTLGKYISEKLGYYWMDTDNYFWQPTDPPYTTKRDRLERIALMKKDVLKWRNVVISGSLVGWGNELIPFFTLTIRIETETTIRLERLNKRERTRFGVRIDIGGDMYDTHRKFIEWASAYDTGDLNIRSKAKHDEWQKLLHCKQIELDGGNTLEHNFKIVQTYL